MELTNFYAACCITRCVRWALAQAAGVLSLISLAFIDGSHVSTSRR